MKINQGSLSWVRRVFAVDDAAGCPVLIRAERRGAKVVWRPCSLESVAAEITEQDLLVAGLPVGPGMTTWLTTALLDSRKVQQILPSVLDTKLPFALEDCLFGFSNTVSGSQPGLPVMGAGTAALAVVVRQHDLAMQEAAWARHHLAPLVYDHEGVALWSRVAEQAAPHVLQVVVWCRSTSMFIVLGLGQVYWSSHQVAGCDLERVMQIIRLQKQTLAKGNYKDVALTWHVGGDAEQVGRLAAELAAGGAQVQELPDGNYYLARTLAERVLLPGPWRLPPVVSTGRQAVYEGILCRRYRRNIAVLVGCAVLLIAGVVGRRVLVRQQLQQADQVHARVVTSIVGYPVAARGHHAVRMAEETLATRRATLAAFEPREDLSRVGGELAAVAEAEGGYVQHLLLDADRARVTLWLPEDRTAASMLRALEELGFVPGAIETGDRAAGMVEMRLQAERGHP